MDGTLAAAAVRLKVRGDVSAGAKGFLVCTTLPVSNNPNATDRDPGCLDVVLTAASSLARSMRLLLAKRAVSQQDEHPSAA